MGRGAYIAAVADEGSLQDVRRISPLTEECSQTTNRSVLCERTGSGLDKGAGVARCLSALSLSSVCCSSFTTDHSPLTRKPIVKLWDMQQVLSGSRCGRSASVGDHGRRLSGSR